MASTIDSRELSVDNDKVLDLESAKSAGHDSGIIQTAKEQLFSVLFVLVGFLQQLSLIQVEGLNFELWGTIFAFLRSFSLNFNLDFAEESQEVFLLCFALPFPFLLLLGTTSAHFNIKAEDGLHYPLILGKKEIFYFFLTLTSFVVGFVLFFVAKQEVAAMPFFAVGTYIVLFYLYIFAQYIYLKNITHNWFTDVYVKYENFKDSEIKTLIFVWASVFTFVVTVWLEVGVLNTNLAIKIIFSVLGSLVTLYMIVFVALISRLATTIEPYPRLQKILQKCYFLHGFYFVDTDKSRHQKLDFGSNRNGIPTFLVEYQFKYTGDLIEYFKNSRYFFFLILLLEKFLLIFVQIIIANEFSIDPEYLGVIDLAIISFMFLLVLFFQPYSEFLLNAADLTGRLSNLLLLGSATFLTFLDTEENQQIVFGLNIFMILISFLTALFWFYILIKAGIINYMLSLPKKIFKSSRTRLQAREISNCNSLSGISTLLKSYDANQEISEALWNKLSIYDKLKTMLVTRNSVIPEISEDEKQKQDTIFLRTDEVLDNNAVLRQYGFAYYLKNDKFYSLGIDRFDFSRENELYLDLLIESTFFKDCKTLTSLSLRATRLKFSKFVKLLMSLPSLKSLRLSENNFVYDNEEDQTEEEIAGLKTLEPVFQKIETLVILLHFQTKPVSMELLKILSNCFFESLRITISTYDVEVVELLYKLVEDRLFFKHFPSADELNIDKDLKRKFVNLIQFKRVECPDIKLGQDNRTDKEKSVMVRDGEIVGFSKDTWVNARDGINAFVLATLKAFNTEEEKMKIKEIINHRWEDVWIKKTHGDIGEREEKMMEIYEGNKRQLLQINLTGETLLELVLLNGISFVAETVEALLEAGADTSLELTDGSTTLEALILEHEDENVSGLLA